MKGHVPGDIEVTIDPGLGNRKFFSDPGENFVVVIRNCSECTVTDEEEGIVRQPVHDLGAIWHESSLIEAWQEGDCVVLDTIIGELRMKYEALDLYLDSGRPIRYEELEASVAAWWKHWTEYWDQKTREEFEKPPEEGGPRISVLSYAIRKDTAGTVWVHVLIKNVGGAPAYELRLRLTATLNGQVVATGLRPLWFYSFVNVGQTASMSVDASSDIPGGASIEWATAFYQTDRQPPKLTLTSSGLTRDENGNVIAVGAIRNDDTSLVKGVRAIAAFLNARGDILYSASAYAGVTSLDPGDITDFRVETTVKSADVVSVDMYITGYHPR